LNKRKPFPALFTTRGPKPGDKARLASFSSGRRGQRPNGPWSGQGPCGLCLSQAGRWCSSGPIRGSRPRWPNCGLQRGWHRRRGVRANRGAAWVRARAARWCTRAAARWRARLQRGAARAASWRGMERRGEGCAHRCDGEQERRRWRPGGVRLLRGDARQGATVAASRLVAFGARGGTWRRGVVAAHGRVMAERRGAEHGAAARMWRGARGSSLARLGGGEVLRAGGREVACTSYGGPGGAFLRRCAVCGHGGHGCADVRDRGSVGHGAALRGHAGARARRGRGGVAGCARRCEGVFA